MANILLVEDDVTFTLVLQGFLKKHGHEVDIKYKIKDGLHSFSTATYQLVLLDYRLPDGTGLDFIRSVRLHDQHTPVIVMTSFKDVKTAVDIIKAGASDYITKPVNPDELIMIINEKIHKKDVPQTAVEETDQFIEGISERSKQLHEYIELVASTDMAVIIQGESGTGKEQAALNIHRLSKRATNPFIAIDCGALSSELSSSELFGHAKGAFTGAIKDKKGQFEIAAGGTLFLDEIGNLNYEVQVKLLRALQEKQVQPIGSNHLVKTNVRIITATNDDLLLKVKQGSFREDLYHRLNEFKIMLPALRQRQEDIEKFIEHFITVSNAELNKQVTGISPEAIQIFREYHWPGNLRELKNIIKRAVLLAGNNILGKELLPDEMIMESYAHPYQSEYDLKVIQELNERETIIKTLQETKYNKSRAARLLNIDRKTLYLKLAKYNIAH